MPRHTCLSSDQHSVANAGTSRNSNHPRQYATLPDAHVVPDLNQIIEPCSAPDDRVRSGPSIDCGVCTDLDIILQNHAPDLRYGYSSRRRNRKTESGLADPRTGKDTHPVSDEGKSDGNSGPDMTVISDTDFITDVCVRTNPAIPANHGTRPNNSASAETGPLTYRGTGVNRFFPVPAQV